MSRSVDLVIVGLTAEARAAAIAAARCGQRVLVVDATTSRCRCRRFRRALTAALGEAQERVVVLTAVEVVCVDGAPAVEAVLVRRLANGRLLAFNACAFLATTRVAAGVIAPACRRREAFSPARREELETG